MCDILNHPCKICGADLPLHLGDYDTAREEVECYCEKHIPTINCRSFCLTDDDIDPEYYKPGNPIDFPKGYKMAIRALTENARENKDKNYPNVFADWTFEDV